MRQVTEKSVAVFLSNDSATISMGNTQVTFCESADEKALLLHGHCIALHNLKTGKIEISNCGYDTNTTKERLNGVILMSDAENTSGIYQEKGVWYWKGRNKQNRQEFPYNEMTAIN